MNAAAGAATKGDNTRRRLLGAAEALFAQRGIEKTPTRAILKAAEQRNESALQYHFGGREGLVQALYQRRGEQVGRQRAALLAEFDQRSIDQPEAKHSRIRALCEVAFLPAVMVAQSDPSFPQFLKVIGQMAFLPSKALEEIQGRYEGETITAVAERLRPALDLPEPVLRHRVELLSRMAAVALSQRARNESPFEGPDADFYFANLVDGMAALLQAPVSAETYRHLGRAGLEPSEDDAR